MRLFPLVLIFATSLHAQPADLTQWNRILKSYFNPAVGFDYAGLKAKEAKTLEALRQQLARVNVDALSKPDQLAHWINVYNINVVGTIVEHYPVDSIRDISTDPIVRLNVFKKERVPLGNTRVSLDTIEHEKIREGFKDARIHFAINCAAKSCPPVASEAFVGSKLSAQLDAQARAFLNGPYGVRLVRDGEKLTLHVTKLLDWFGDDFEKWGGGKVPFLRRYLPPEKQNLINQFEKVTIEYDDYDWSLNDWKR